MDECLTDLQEARVSNHKNHASRTQKKNKLSWKPRLTRTLTISVSELALPWQHGNAANVLGTLPSGGHGDRQIYYL